MSTQKESYEQQLTKGGVDKETAAKVAEILSKGELATKPSDLEALRNAHQQIQK